MHIKQITLSNFRSFRQQEEIQPFSPGTNAVVGRNGSGKSNLFDAVQFCLLAPKFAHLRQEERQALLHEGSGAAAVNAFVEIVFDNSDHRFQHENSDEVVLRRTIGLKKDEFFLQRKRTTKNEIQSLLEGAGFSKSNPYFIVQQGKVQALCTMSDDARLHLLKEVAGTTVYDEKKAESLAKMEENRKSIDKITEMLDNIEERLSELNSEKDELTAYQQLDRQRRAAEYSLYNIELEKARVQLVQIEHERAQHVQAIAELHEASKATHDAIRNIEGQARTKTNSLKRLSRNVAAIEEDKRRAVGEFTRLECECNELEEAITASDEQAKTNQKLLQDLEAQIEKVQNQLEKTTAPSCVSAEEKLQELLDGKDEVAKQREALLAKQGRGSQFQTTEERDAFLQRAKQDLESTKEESELELGNQRDNLANLRRTVDQEESAVSKLKAEITKKAAVQQTIAKSIDEMTKKRVELTEFRRKHWRGVEELQERVRESRESLHTCLSDTRKVMPRATAMGLEALRGIVEREGIVQGRQYFGMVLENFTLTDDKYRTAVEAAAQNSLFHVIVDTDHTAARLMKHLEDGKLGRVTFLPLNQLRIETVKYPDNSEIRPMIGECLEFDNSVSKAMKHIFGKKLVARTKELASDWSTKVDMDVLTLDGDLCGRKGALTGGYVDSNKSRIRAFSKQIAAQEALNNVQQEHASKKAESQKVEDELHSLMQTLRRQEAKQAELNRQTETKDTEISRHEGRVKSHQDQVENLEKVVIPKLERKITEATADMKRLDDEMATELQHFLSDEERAKLGELKEDLERFGEKVESQQQIVDGLRHEKQKLEGFLQNNLLKRKAEIQESSDAFNESDRRQSFRRMSTTQLRDQQSSELQERQLERDSAARHKEEVIRQLDEARQTESDMKKELMILAKRLDDLQAEDMKNVKAWEDSEHQSERFLTKRSMYIGKRESNSRKISELGSLPPPAELNKFSGKSASQLEKSLDSINQKLKKYSHVNKKAFEQYVNFNDSRESLLKRKEELDRGAERVEELIESLDHKKDEAINRTFRGVSKNFREVFKDLVPNGSGELVMRTASETTGDEKDAANSESESEDDDMSPDSGKKPAAANKNLDVSLCRGIGIKVRFAENSECFLMSQLSGGQKALVAMALIFSIQRCDPAPFYLFDELDQALDSTYRAAVANVIHRQANDKTSPTQFIVSTFRQELVSIANRCYGIAHQNKVSSIYHMPKRDAQTFISNLMSEEEAVGEVTTMTSSKVSLKSKDSRKRKSPEIALKNDDGEGSDINDE